ncbi:hypothetical protein SAMN05216276_10429 [Streptosporangium subroseum]|uniref:Uncharacterized protein n=1 Tax=Streptosporangium subroseum TaxID=106412 RepID=A0A239MK41_9ACTN|nr:hypothetical protein [Streptosporangium subroseum]SNT42633.1 hypothetical protein SAMN05216276_10429 [Streptosporangium subroseum]
MGKNPNENDKNRVENKESSARPASSSTQRNSRMNSGMANRGDSSTIALIKDLDGKFSALSANLGQRIRAEVQSGIRAALADQIRSEIETDVRAEIVHEVRIEMAGRLKSMIADHARLDPAKILHDFSLHVAELLEKSDNEEIQSLTQQQLINTLRQAVLESFQSRKLHLAQLAELDCYLKESNGSESMKMLANEWLTVAGLQRVDSPVDHPEYFTITNEPTDGYFIDIVQSAYLDSLTGRVVRNGRLRYVSEPTLTQDEPQVSKRTKTGKKV